MANLTDPLVSYLSGTDPQNLMEYITRRKIYDCRYWKEECFGLTAVGVLEKATKLTHIGGTYGPMNHPTPFLCLILKLLQIQPEDDLVKELIEQDEFKYVRALGMFYLRFVGRPADIYELLEPAYRDFRKLRLRTNASDWTLMRVDELVEDLLERTRICGISVPRLPQRQVLVDAGYLEEERPTALRQVIEEAGGIREYIRARARESDPVRELWKEVSPEEYQAEQEARENQLRREEKKKKREKEASKDTSRPKKKARNYGSLFKKSKTAPSEEKDEEEKAAVQENSEEYWNEERAKLGLKALK